MSSLFGSTSYWRDHLGLSDTKYTTLVGAKKIIAYIKNNGTDCNIKSFALENGKEPQVGAIDPRGTVKCLQAFITFETKTGNGRGIITLLQDVENADEWRIFNLFTTLWEWKDFPAATGDTRPYSGKPASAPATMSWREYRDMKRDFLDEEPTVLIVGELQEKTF